VNFAARLESSASQGEVRCSQRIHDALGERWRFEDCGLMELKGKGQQQVWKLLGRSESPQ
jgi:adenylate cyclase